MSSVSTRKAAVARAEALIDQAEAPAEGKVSRSAMWQPPPPPPPKYGRSWRKKMHELYDAPRTPYGQSRERLEAIYQAIDESPNELAARAAIAAIQRQPETMETRTRSGAVMTSQLGISSETFDIAHGLETDSYGNHRVKRPKKGRIRSVNPILARSLTTFERR